MKFTIVNLDEIPDDLPPGKYDTRVVSAEWDEIEVRFINELYNPNNPQSLIQLIKHPDGTTNLS